MTCQSQPKWRPNALCSSVSLSIQATKMTIQDTVKGVCVFCASSPGNDPVYGNAAKSVGVTLAERGYTLVYGGGLRGLMGMTAEAALSHPKGRVIGVLPKALASKETTRALGKPAGVSSSEGRGDQVVKDDDTYGGRIDLELVDDMHSRKQRMAELSDSFIVLPGGFGTFEELMEMVTWNQLGIHKKPIVVLNIKEFYTPIMTLMRQAVDEGFIQPQNLSLIKVVDIKDGEDVGKIALDAVENWKWENGAGYDLTWTSEAKLPDFSLFSTARYSCTSSTLSRDDIPLFERHVLRLSTAHAFFSERDGEDVWGVWPGDELVWNAVEAACAGQDKVDKDFRVRILLAPNSLPVVELHPAPVGGPFGLDLSSDNLPRRPLILDPEITDTTTVDQSLFMYKTTKRDAYDAATARCAALVTLEPGVIYEALLHTSTHITESSTSNIAIFAPDAKHPDAPPYVTPRLTEDETPGLQGVTRAELLERGLIRIGEVRIQDFLQAVEEGRRIIGFNALRGVWEAEVKR